MPNPKTGTIAPDVAKLIKELKQGKVSYKNDPAGTVHVQLGKVSFPTEHLIANIQAFVESLKKAKPDTMKGIYLRSVYLTTTMGPSVRVGV
jgi:large subunit ribosomal protein L1